MGRYSSYLMPKQDVGIPKQSHPNPGSATTMVTLYFFGQKEIRMPTIYMPVHEEINFALGADGGDGGAAEALGRHP